MESKRKVIIIDDDLHLLQTAKTLLEEGGFEVHTKNIAFDSTNFIIRHQPDAVLLDVNMPFLSGDRLFEILRERTRTRFIPVIYFSSNDEGSLRKLVRETGAFGYLSKSELGSHFATRVGELIDRAQQHQEH